MIRFDEKGAHVLPPDDGEWYIVRVRVRRKGDVLSFWGANIYDGDGRAIPGYQNIPLTPLKATMAGFTSDREREEVG